MDSVEFIQTDGRGRTNLGKSFADQLFTIERQDSGNVLLSPAKIVSAVDTFFADHPDILDVTLTDANTSARKPR